MSSTGSRPSRAVPMVLVNDIEDSRDTVTPQPPSTSDVPVSRSKRWSAASTIQSKADVFRDVVEQLMVKKEMGELDTDKAFDIDDDREYDTDIELKDNSLPTYDPWGRHTYRTTCNRIGINPLTQIIKTLRKSRIIMKGQGLGWKDALAISYSLLENVTISVLDLDGNNIGAKGAKYIACMLGENNHIRKLSLADNGIGNDGLQFIVDSLITNQSVANCCLSGNDIDDGAAYEISDLLTHNKTLFDLDLSHNHLANVGADVIGSAIADNEYLKRLDLSWNKIRPVGMAFLLNGVQQNETLKELNVSMNGADLLGAEAAADMLKANRSLTILHLTNTRVSDQGLGLIAQALAVNDSLQSFNISQNLVTASGASVLVDCLKKNDGSALGYIDLSTTHVLQDFMDDLEELKKCLPNLVVDVGGIVSTYHAIDGAKTGDLKNKNPLTLLRWYIASKSLRLIDLFRQFDKDNSMTVSRAEFVEGLDSIKMPLTQDQVERLIEMLDKDGDGEVDYGELIAGDKAHRKKLRKIRGSLQQQQQQAVEKLVSPASISPLSRPSRTSIDRRSRVSRDEDSEATSELKSLRAPAPTRKISTVMAPNISQI